MKPALAILVAVAGLLFAAAPAAAFVRSTTDKGTPVYWSTSCTTITPDTDAPVELGLGATLVTIDKSIADWQTPTLTAGCSYLLLERAAPAAVEATLDHKNVIKFRNDKWCRPADSAEAEMCYSPDAAAITTVFYADEPGKSGDGAIVDADIELNDINYTFVTEPTTAKPRTGTTNADLENTLTHELGHFQGLDHTCWDHATPTQPKDDMGNLIPTCTDVQQHLVPQAEYDQITQSTMYNYASPGETLKRTPKPDDIRGICSIYPKAKDPNNCNGSSGCTIAARRSTPTGMLAFIGVILCAGIAGSVFRRQRPKS